MTGVASQKFSKNPTGDDMKDLPKFIPQMLLVALGAAAFVMIVLPFNALAAGSDELPEAKRTRAALYLEARQVPAFIDQQGGQGRSCSSTFARAQRPCSSAWLTASMPSSRSSNTRI